jgi:hypothetical protein
VLSNSKNAKKDNAKKKRANKKNVKNVRILIVLMNQLNIRGYSTGL